jgi:CTP synthase
MCRFIVVTGGVVSGIGKGVSAASIGLLLKMRGERVVIAKFDPYYNRSASWLSPYQHGECWVCDDGSETDLDLGTYERITGLEVSSKNIYTSGALIHEMLENEAKGMYRGQTVQVSPHLTDSIIEKLLALGTDADVVIAEIGGTVGDAESWHYYRAVRQLRQRMGTENVMICHVAPILWINTIEEYKTKPLQNSVEELQRSGLEPDILLCRIMRQYDRKFSEEEQEDESKLISEILTKISNITGVAREAVFDAPDVKSIYQVPICFFERHIDDLIADRFKLKRNGVRIHKYRDLVEKYIACDLPEINIGIVGKYAKSAEAYLSLKEAVYHAGVANNVRANIVWMEADKLEQYQSLRGLNKHFENIDAVIVPGGFDNRGVEGKIRAIQYAREKKVPFLGICLGLQCAVIEYARNVCDMPLANSQEFAPTQDAETWAVHYIAGQEDIKKKGGELRLGAYDCLISKNSVAAGIYKKRSISERHRHRYEVNSAFLDRLDKKGLRVSGVNPGSNLVEIMEMDKGSHPFFVGCQFHPEFKSRLDTPHPLFEELVVSAIAFRNKNEISIVGPEEAVIK